MLTMTFRRLWSWSTSSTSAVETQEWSIDDADIVALDEFHLLTRSRLRRHHLLQQGLHFFR